MAKYFLEKDHSDFGRTAIDPCSCKNSIPRSENKIFNAILFIQNRIQGICSRLEESCIARLGDSKSRLPVLKCHIPISRAGNRIIAAYKKLGFYQKPNVSLIWGEFL